MTLIVGTTNLDGTGSASNLTADNGTVIDIGDSNSFQNVLNEEWGSELILDNIEIDKGGDHYGSLSVLIYNTAEWNAEGMKEIYLDSNFTEMAMATLDCYQGGISIYNFVDVYINFSDPDTFGDYSWNIGVNIYGAKRGDIDLSSLDISLTWLNIVPYSNGDSWSNMFTVTMGDSDDYVTFTSSNYAYTSDATQWTEFDVSLNGGDDTFTYALDAAASSDQTRYVDGGDGDDTLELETDSGILDFANFESIENGSDDDLTVTLSEDLLEANSELTITDLDIEFSDDYDSITVEETDSDYYTVTVVYDDESFTLSTNVINDDWLLAS